MRIYLSALGWITDAPAGNRLRWVYPYDAIIDGAFAGPPEVLVVERAPLSKDRAWQLEPVARHLSSLTPVDWWDARGDVALGLFPDAFPLGGVQGVRFTYRGPTARVLAVDADRPLMYAFDQVVSDGDAVIIEGSNLDELRVLAFGGAGLEDLRLLDLFADHPELDWQAIAEIRVADTVTASWADVEPRRDGPGTMDDPRWTDLLGVAQGAIAEVPAAVPPGASNAWRALETLLGIRWEHALLFGSAWFDGPRSQVSSLDRVDPAAVLQTLPLTPMAYRIVEPEGRLGSPTSNIVIVMDSVASALAPLAAPTYDDAEVRLDAASHLRASATLKWVASDPNAIGVRVREEVSASASTGAPSAGSSFIHRTRRAGDPPLGGQVRRELEVSWHDVTLQASVGAVDAWDREGPPSPMGPPTPLQLRHTPVAPPLSWARRDGGVVTLRRAIPKIGSPGPQEDWAPDVIVQRAAGRVIVLKRLMSPALAEVVFDDPWPVPGTTEYLVHIVAPVSFNASPYLRGSLIVGSVRAGIVSAGPPGPGGTELRFEPVLDGRLNPVVFGAGAGVVQEDAWNPALWMEVASFGVDSLPDELVFTEPGPLPTDAAETASYTTAVTFLGRRGPIANTVTATLLPVIPIQPPPFVVTRLGHDFFARTLVKVELTSAVPGGTFTLWWADGFAGDPGWPAGSPFQDHASPGDYGNQAAVGGTVLYDVLSLPIPGVRDRRVTFGLQRVNGAGGQSPFETVQVTLPHI
jgi:hypothetical protein